MSLKLEFALLAGVEGSDMSALCRRFGISRGCGYKWLERFRQEGEGGLGERSRRPHHSPKRSAAEIEAAVVATRREHPAWGGRKIAAALRREGLAAPAASTVTAIVRRQGLALGGFGGGNKAFCRFEHESPNDLWQMDFKGHVAMRQERLHPLTVLDDHSRFALDLGACGNEREATVKERLETTFGRYGLPWRMAVDNGSPWGDSMGGGFTPLCVWLIELGIAVTHSRPYHPQTLGKDERFHRSLKAEVLSGAPFENLEQAQTALDRWRDIYNCKRPHEALGLAVPAERYRPSARAYNGQPEPFDYAPGDLIRTVQQHGWASLKNRPIRISRAFVGKAIAFRPTHTDQIYDVFFRHQFIKTIDLKSLDTSP